MTVRSRSVEVGVRELKARLSEFLDRAERGETIRVTHRGRLKAVIVPAGEDRIGQGIAEGWIRPAKGRPPSRWRSFPARLTVEQLLAEDRGK